MEANLSRSAQLTIDGMAQGRVCQLVGARGTGICALPLADDLGAQRFVQQVEQPVFVLPGHLLQHIEREPGRHG